MQSKQKQVSVIGRDGGRGGKEETSVVEMDMTFARTLGLVDFQKVRPSISTGHAPLMSQHR